MGTRAAAVLGREAWWEGILVNRDDIIRMAKESGLDSILDDWLHEFTPGNWPETDIQELDHFVALVAAAEREKVAAWMRSKSYATGHGDTTEDLLEEIQAQVAENERWKCAEIAEAYEPRCDVCPKGVAAAIRTRGERI